MITISHRPAAVAVREQASPFGDREIVVFGVDPDTGVVVEICVDAETARTLGAQLAAPSVQTATPADLDQLRRNGQDPGRT